jgi:uncharacterized membrane protein required for colicin V production
MPPLDVLMLFLWIGFVLVGSLTGSVRQLLLLVAIFAAAVLAGTLYAYAARALLYIFVSTMTLEAAEGFLLLVLFFVFLAVIYILISSTWKETRPVSKRAHLYDALLGGLLGVACGLMFVVVLYATLAFATMNPWPSGDATRITLQDQVNRSVVQVVLAEKLPVAYIVLRPFFPRGIPGFPVA